MEMPSDFSELKGIQELISVPNPGDVNCHKAVLYLAGLISYEELTSDSKAERKQGLDFTYGKRARSMSDKEFVPVVNAEELNDLAKKECIEDLLYVGQILDAVDNDMAHSFLLTKRGDDFICFDKAGFNTDFSIYNLESLLNFTNYQNQLWRFFHIKKLSSFQHCPRLPRIK